MKFKALFEIIDKPNEPFYEIQPTSRVGETEWRFVDINEFYNHDDKQLTDWLPCLNFKDKNGREIYVGDIIIWEACSCEVKFGFHTVSCDADRTPLDRAYGFYLYVIDMQCDEPIDENVIENCEIIGNIYEKR